MSSKEHEIEVKDNNLTLVNETVPQLISMITEAVSYQIEINPLYQKIHKKILDMFEKDEELENLEVKELIKLMELTQKAQLAPVEQLTKLVQATAALHERSEVDKKTKALDELISKFDSYSNASTIVVVEEPRETEEDNTMQDLEDIL